MRAGSVLLLAALCWALAARAVEEQVPPARSARAERLVCYRMVQSAGRWVAWARWEGQLSEAATRSNSQSVSDAVGGAKLIDAWIDDAYAWRATDEQVLEWATELGSAASLPHANELSTHETIAIWLRRIARRCGQ